VNSANAVNQNDGTMRKFCIHRLTTTRSCKPFALTFPCHSSFVVHFNSFVSAYATTKIRAMASRQEGTFAVKAGLAQMLKGGVIMDVTNVEEARIAEEAGACAVMALERVPADIRRHATLLNKLEASFRQLTAFEVSFSQCSLVHIE
jgi:hypothetical protein